MKLPLNKLSEIWDTYDTDGNHQLDQTENRQLIADYFSEAVKAQPELVVKTQVRGVGCARVASRHISDNARSTMLACVCANE